MKFKLLFIVIAMLLLCGCGTKLTEGEVYAKQFIEAHSDVGSVRLSFWNPATKVNKIFTVPRTYYYPDAYAIHIRAIQDNEWVTAVYYVPEDVYNSVSVGDTFKYEKGRDSMTMPYSISAQIG